MIDPNELERLSNPREALEDAFRVVFGPKPDTIWKDEVLREEWTDEYSAWFERSCRFYTLLDAEAYIDAAMMLIPDNWTAWEMRSHAARSHFSADLSRLSECDAGQEDWAHGRGRHPALALAEAALRAQEAGDV